MDGIIIKFWSIICRVFISHLFLGNMKSHKAYIMRADSFAFKPHALHGRRLIKKIDNLDYSLWITSLKKQTFWLGQPGHCYTKRDIKWLYSQSAGWYIESAGERRTQSYFTNSTIISLYLLMKKKINEIDSSGFAVDRYSRAHRCGLRRGWCLFELYRRRIYVLENEKLHSRPVCGLQLS